MPKALTEQQFIEHLRSQFGWKGMATYAKKVGVANGFLSDILAGNKKPGRVTARKLGFEIITVTTYVPIRGKKNR